MLKDELQNGFNERLKELIDESVKAGKSENEIAKKIGITQSCLNTYKNKKDRLPRPVELVKIANTFNVSCDWLLGRTDTRTPVPTIAAACKTTGLSEKSVSLLSAEETLLNEEFPGEPNRIAITIDTLLKDTDLLKLIFTYLYDDHKSLKIRKDNQKDTITAESITGYNLSDFERLARISLSDAFSDFRKKLEPERQKLSEDPYTGITAESRERETQIENGLAAERKRRRKAKNQLSEKGESTNGKHTEENDE